MRSNSDIGRLFVLIFIFFLIIPVFLVALYFVYSIYDSNNRKVTSDAEIITHSLALKVNTQVEGPAKYTMTIAELLERNKSNTHKEELLEAGLKHFPMIDSLYILDLDKRIKNIAFDSFGKYSKSDFYDIKLNNVKSFKLFSLYWSRPFVSMITSNNVVRVSVRCTEGYVVCDINLKYLSEDLMHARDLKDTNVFIVDDKGDVISVAGDNENLVHENYFAHPVVQEGYRGGHVVSGYYNLGDRKIGASFKIPVTGWFLILEQNYSSAYSFFSKIMNVAFVSLFIVTFFMLFMLHYIRRRLIRPIRVLTEKSALISKGEYTGSMKDEGRVFSEIQTLYESFENMSGKIREREEALRDKEEYIRSIFDSTKNTGILVISAGEDSVIEDANMGAQLMLGYKLSELLGFHPAALIEGGSDGIGRLQKEALQKEAMTTGRLEMMKKSGVTFPVLCTVHPLVSAEQKVEKMIVVFINISEITRVQNALESEKERLDVTLKSIGEGVLATDRAGRITIINGSAEFTLAQKARYLIGYNIKDVLHIYDYDSGEDLVPKLTTTDDSSRRTFRANIVSKHAGIISVNITSSRMLSSKGEIIGFVYVFRDITEDLKKDKELIERKMQLEEMNSLLEVRIGEETEKRRRNEQLLFEQAKFAAMGQMISAIAHQWRQPLNALALYTQDIEDAYEAGEVNAEYLHVFVVNAMKLIQHMSGTIDDFRNFFHSSNVKEKVCMESVVKDSLSLISTQLKNQNVNYKLTVSADGENAVYENILPALDREYGERVYISTSEMKQVLLNILQNAREAINEQRNIGNKRAGSIDITVEYSKGKVVTQIKNDGGKIPEDVLVRIFDPYYTTKPEGVGTGIGLYMSKVMVEDHMGGLLIASNVDNGAMFTITLYN